MGGLSLSQCVLARLLCYARAGVVLAVSPRPQTRRALSVGGGMLQLTGCCAEAFGAMFAVFPAVFDCMDTLRPLVAPGPRAPSAGASAAAPAAAGCSQGWGLCCVCLSEALGGARGWAARSLLAGQLQCSRTGQGHGAARAASRCQLEVSRSSK